MEKPNVVGNKLLKQKGKDEGVKDEEKKEKLKRKNCTKYSYILNYCIILCTCIYQI